MSDLTPPPDEPMPDQARARIRDELLRSAGSGSTAPRWAAPTLAAAAVLVVAGAAAWAVQLGGDGRSGDSLGPAGSSSQAPTPPPLPPPTVRPTPGATLPTLPDPTSPQPGQVGTAPCEEEATMVLPGAQQAVSIPDGGATTSFWVTGERFVLCDVRAGTTTVHHPMPLTPAMSVETFRVSSLYAPTEDGFRTVRVAGGIVPDGAMAYDVRYAFPDGSTEVANTATDDQGRTWWLMVHAAPSDGGNEMDDPPIEATVSLSGVRHTYRLEWGVDTCAQANHGC